MDNYESRFRSIRQKVHEDVKTQIQKVEEQRKNSSEEISKYFNSLQVQSTKPLRKMRQTTELNDINSRANLSKSILNSSLPSLYNQNGDKDVRNSSLQMLN